MSLIENKKERLDYFTCTKNALNLAKIVAKCKDNPLASCLSHDHIIGLEIDKLLNSMDALSYKYLYCGEVDKLPSDFAFSKDQDSPQI